MEFIEKDIKGVFLIKMTPIEDRRGFFARSFCHREFDKHNLSFQIAQSSFSYNIKKGTLRGMHYQASPHEEAKLVTCTKGSIYDVVLDLRPTSSTYCQWVSARIHADDNISIYVPKGFAHGFQTLEKDTVVYYQMSEFYYPESSRGVRWNDTKFRIQWPITSPILSEKDESYPDF